MTTSFKPNPGINPAALPEWRKITGAINALERAASRHQGTLTNHSRTMGATIIRASEAATGYTPDIRTGNAPTGLGAVISGYYDSATGNPYAEVVLTWTPPTTYSNGEPITVAGYEVWRALSGAEWQFVTYVTGATATLMRQPFGGAAYQYEVRAQSADNGLYGAFSAPLSVTPPSTMTALPAPSQPTLTTSLGTVRATWDGLLGGAAPPAGFRGVYAEISVDGGTTWQLKGQNLLFAGAQSVVSYYAGGTSVMVRFRAVDALGVSSAASATQTITVVAIGGPDIAANSVTTNQIAAGNITSALIDTGGLTGITLTGGTIQTLSTASRGIKITGGTFTAYDGSGNATVTINGSTGAVTIGGLIATSATVTGAITATSGAITGTMTVSGTLQTGASGARVQMTSAGLAGYNSAGTQTFSFLTSNGTVNATGGTFTNIAVTGTSTFSGTLSGATGTFSGGITATSGSITGQLTIGTGGSIVTATTYPRTRFDSTGITFDETVGFGVAYGEIDTTHIGLTWWGGTPAGQDPLLYIQYQVYVDPSGNAVLSGNGSTLISSVNGVQLEGLQIKSTAILNYTKGNASSQGGATGAVGSSGQFVIIGTDGIMRPLGTAPFFPQAYGATVTTRALNIGSNGAIGTASSARRTKNLRGTVEMSDDMLEAWLRLPTHRFAYKADPDQLEHVGMIAEEVQAAKHFDHLIYYDETPTKSGKKRKRKKVDGLAYERMPVYNRMALGRLYDRLIAAEKRIAQLEGS
jgi:hypothetical protein